MVAAAVIGSAVVGAGASVAAGNKAAGAAKSAAAQSAAIEKYQYDTTRADYAPYRRVGKDALEQLSRISGIGDNTDWEGYAKADPAAMDDWRLHWSGGNNSLGDMSLGEYGRFHYNLDGQKRDLTPFQSKGADFSDFYNSPGYLFRLNEGQKAIERSVAARGGLYSGATMKAVNANAQGVASDEFNNYVARLQSLAGVGQSATGSTAAAGAQAANGMSQAAQQAGAARASAYANAGNAINQAVGGAAGGMLYMQGLNGGGGGTVATGGTPVMGGAYNRYMGIGS